MYRIVFAATLAAVAFGQTAPPQPEKPPSPQEQAVIARVNELFTMFVKGDYRKAEAWIAEDTKDYYYGGAKPDIHKFEVMSVEFSDATHAKALVRCTEPVVIAGFPPGDMTVTIPTLWKVEGGNWVYYEDPEKIHNPGGVTAGKVQAALKNAAAGNALPPPAAMLRDLPKDPAFTLGKLAADKGVITLSAGSEDKVMIANGLPGTVSLEPGAPLQGIEITLDRTDVPRGEKATVTFKAGKEPRGGTYYLRIMPTGEALGIQVEVK